MFFLHIIKTPPSFLVHFWFPFLYKQFYSSFDSFLIYRYFVSTNRCVPFCCAVLQLHVDVRIVLLLWYAQCPTIGISRGPSEYILQIVWGKHLHTIVIIISYHNVILNHTRCINTSPFLQNPNCTTNATHGNPNVTCGLGMSPDDYNLLYAVYAWT